MTLIPAFKKGEALLAEIAAVPADDPRCHVWWLGQSGFLLQYQGTRVLFDPYLSDSLTKKYAETDKPHVRMSELVLDPATLTGLDIITSTHNHTDHLDAETLLPLLQNNPQARLVISEANRAFVAERLGCAVDFPLGLRVVRGDESDEGDFNEDATHFLGFTRVFVSPTGKLAIRGLPAKHNEIERDEAGNYRCMGYLLELGPYTIYHSGDTLWFDELVDLLKPFQVDIAFLPINGNDPARKVAGNLDCKEAAALGKAIGAKWVIPCHYDMFLFNTADVQDFVRAAEALQQPYHVMQGGSCFTLS